MEFYDARGRIGDAFFTRVWSVRYWLADYAVRASEELLKLAGVLSGTPRVSTEAEALQLAAAAVEASAFWQGRAFAAEAESKERAARAEDPERLRAVVNELAYEAGRAQFLLQRAAAPNN